MALMPYLAIFGVLMFAGWSFFFALAESALFSLGKWQIRQLEDKFPATGGLVARLLAEPQHLLATIVFGNTCGECCHPRDYFMGGALETLDCFLLCCRAC